MHHFFIQKLPKPLLQNLAPACAWLPAAASSAPRAAHMPASKRRQRELATAAHARAFRDEKRLAARPPMRR